MAPAPIDTRIFVVGVPRSGTTLVQSLLAAHSRVTSFTESHLFSRHFRPLPRLSSAVLTRDPGPRLREFLAENGLEESDVAARIEARVRRALPARLLSPLRTRAVARQLLRALDELARSRGRPAWVEKTPRHLRFVPFLERFSGPEQRSYFVHVIRDGLETVASLHTASQNWERPYDLETCTERWNADVAFSASRLGKPNDRFLFYERLTSEPEATLERLLMGLGLDWQPEVLERYAEASRRLVTPDESWKENVSRGLRRSGTSESALTVEERRRTARLLRHDLYERLRDRTS